MEIKINGTIRIEENCAAPADNRNTQGSPIPIDHSKDVLLDNATTFNELRGVLARNPEVIIAGQLEAEQQEREKQEAKLREAFGEDYTRIRVNDCVVFPSILTCYMYFSEVICYYRKGKQPRKRRKIQ